MDSYQHRDCVGLLFIVLLLICQSRLVKFEAHLTSSSVHNIELVAPIFVHAVVSVPFFPWDSSRQTGSTSSILSYPLFCPVGCGVGAVRNVPTDDIPLFSSARMGFWQCISRLAADQTDV